MLTLPIFERRSWTPEGLLVALRGWLGHQLGDAGPVLVESVAGNTRSNYLRSFLLWHAFALGRGGLVQSPSLEDRLAFNQ